MNVVGGELIKFRYVAVNQGFTHKIDTPALRDLQYQKCYLFMFDHPFMIYLMKHWFIGEGCLQRNISVRLQKELYRNFYHM